MHLRIAHLYPRRMSIYGDRGNVMTLARRARWRDVAVSVDEIEREDVLEAARYDLFFFGGGQDQEQDVVAADLAKKGPGIREAIRAGAAALAVCGGYQLFGRYYQPAADAGVRPRAGSDPGRLEGIGVFDAYTEAPPAADAGPTERFIGNVVADLDLGALGISAPHGRGAQRRDMPFGKTMDTSSSNVYSLEKTQTRGSDARGTQLVGFENHSGLTFLGKTGRPLARVRVGHGNNGRDRTEGCVTGGAVGTYLHGSLLPKNPRLADWLLTRALRRRHPDFPGLRPLDDTLEQTVNEELAEKRS